MHCASCAHYITKSLSKIEGIEQCDVNIATETAKVNFNPEKIDLQGMNKAVESMGYTLIDTKAKSQTDHASMSAEEHSAHTGINQSKDEKLQELTHMKKNIQVVIPFVALSFLYMILDIGGTQGLFTPMSSRLYELWHHLFPLMATYVLFVIGRQYIVALGRFIKTGIASMDTLIGL